jgi:hypothetical protein
VIILSLKNQSTFAIDLDRQMKPLCLSEAVLSVCKHLSLTAGCLGFLVLQEPVPANPGLCELPPLAAFASPLLDEIEGTVMKVLLLQSLFFLPALFSRHTSINFLLLVGDF